MGAAAVGLIVAGAQTLMSLEANHRETNAKIGEAGENRALAQTAASDAIARGNIEAARARTQGSKLVGKQMVAFANSGVDPTVGTPASVMADTRAISELDAQTLENNAAREAWGFKKHGLKYSQQAALEATRGSNRQTATALTGAGRAVSIYADSYKGE